MHPWWKSQSWKKSLNFKWRQKHKGTHQAGTDGDIAKSRKALGICRFPNTGTKNKQKLVYEIMNQEMSEWLWFIF